MRSDHETVPDYNRMTTFSGLQPQPRASRCELAPATIRQHWEK